jgi:hypothetical protein
MYARDKTLSHALCVRVSYRFYLFILNMRKPFRGLKATVKAISRG